MSSKKRSPILPPPPPSHSRRKSSKSPDKSPKYKVGDEFFSKNYKYNLRIKKITSGIYVFEKADDEIAIGKGDAIGSLSFHDVDDYPKDFVSLKGDGYGYKGGRKTNRKKSGKKNKTGKRLKRSGKKLIVRGGRKYIIGDVVKHIDSNNVKKITSIKIANRNCLYIFDNNQRLFVPCNIVDDEKYYEKIEPEQFDEIINIEDIEEHN